MVFPCDPLEHLWNRRADLSGVSVRAAYNDYVPLAMTDPESGAVTGFCPDMFLRLAELMNFTYSFHPSVDGTHGSR